MKQWQVTLLVVSVVSIALSLLVLTYQGWELMRDADMGKMMPFVMVEPGVSTTMDPRK